MGALIKRMREAVVAYEHNSNLTEYATPERSVHETVNSCKWVENPAVSIREVCEWNGKRTVCSNRVFYNGAPLSSAETVVFSTYVCGPYDIVTVYPATSLIPGQARPSSSNDRRLLAYNAGWNSSARSVSALSHGRYATISSGASHGVFFALDRVGMDHGGISSFRHGIMRDSSGTRVYEYGEMVFDLGPPDTATYPDYFGFGIWPGGLVEYRSSTRRYFSRMPSVGEAYIYGKLYYGDESADVTVGAISAWSLPEAQQVRLGGLSSLRLAASVNGEYRLVAVLGGTGELSGGGEVTSETGVVLQEKVTAWMASGTSTLLCSHTQSDALGFLPAMQGFCAEPSDFGVGVGVLPSISIVGGSDEVSPSTISEGVGYLTALSGMGLVITIDYCQGSAVLPALQAVGGDYVYGVGYAHLPAAVSWGYEGFADEMLMMSHSIIGDTQAQQAELVLVLNSDGILQSVYVDSIVKVQEYLSALLVDSQFSLIGTYGMAQLSALTAMSLQAQAVAGHAALDDVGRVWVVNMESAASTQYDNYGFNSFFVRNGESYGVAGDGIYRLTGDTDLLEPISAQLNLGSNRLGASTDKRLPAVYINAASNGKLIMKVEVDGAAPYYYEARSSSEALDNHRVDTGRGLKGNNWTFTLMNQDGDDFELANLEFVPLQGSRRI